MECDFDSIYYRGDGLVKIVFVCVESRLIRILLVNEVNLVIIDGIRFVEYKNIKCRNFVFVCIVVLLFEIWNKLICINSGNILLKYKLY